jgi:hypothetical protein
MMLAFSSVSAQKTGEASAEIVLAEGRGDLTQPMVDRLIDFFEWSLEVKLSNEERLELQSAVVENWKERNCREIEGVRYVLRLADDKQNWDAEELGQMQALYKNRFSKELERSPSKKINSLILSSSRLSQSGSGELATDGDQ